jgi:hypothetical protein
VTYVDGRGDRAQKTPREPVRGERAIRAIAVELLDRAVTRRVRVRRLRLEAWEGAPVGAQLSLWGAAEGAGTGARAAALESAVHTLRTRFGTEAVVPAHWMALGVARGSSL